VPGAGRGRVPQVKLNISLPKVLADRIEELIHRDGSANSVPDFVRQAAVKEVERRLGDHEVVDEGAEKTLKRTKAV
jgi:Arc/MetJ-type ribon-helix-helix transcriptional regulator